MKQKIMMAILVLLATTGSAHADLIVRGTDSLGNQLIYDTVQNITWYDHTFKGVDFHSFPATFASQFGDTTLTGWRLPKHLGTPVTFWDDPGPETPMTDELGVLWRDELGNHFDSSPTGNNKGPFTDLFPEIRWYWLPGGWYINNNAKDWGHVSGAWTLLVRDGDVPAPVPEPATAALLVSGLTLFGIKRKKFS